MEDTLRPPSSKIDDRGVPEWPKRFSYLPDAAVIRTRGLQVRTSPICAVDTQEISVSQDILSYTYFIVWTLSIAELDSSSYILGYFPKLIPIFLSWISLLSC